MVAEGDIAPTFTLPGVYDGEISTYSLEERLEQGPVVLSFHVFDFAPPCADQVCDIDDVGLLGFEDDLTVFGLSPDGPYSHMEFMADNDIDYPLLCDTAHEVAEKYGVLNEEWEGLANVTQRSLFLIDSEGRVRFQWTATDNNDEWSVRPVQELKSRLDELR